MLAKILTLAILVVLISAEQVRYDNYALYKVEAHSEEHITFLNELNKEEDFVKFWKLPEDVGDFASVVSSPGKRDEFENKLKEHGLHPVLMLDNIQEAFDAQVLRRRKRAASGQLFWTNYQTVDDIYNWFNYLSSNYNSVSQITVGQTAEGRNITGLRITRGTGNRVFVLQAGEIAADWLSPTVLTYFADQLIRSDDPEIRSVAEDFTWYIFPMLNIDGHEFTQNSIRLWVKNRRPISNTATGVDLSKNWNSQWGVSGGSYNFADDNFIGLGPFSESETRGLSDYIVNNIGARLTGFLNFRGFGQRLLIPFAHTNTPMYNYNEMLTIGRRAMGALSARYNTQYLVGTSGAVSNGATGSVIDWAKHRFNPPIAATYLLRDTGVWGYTLPVSQITPTCEETFDSLLSIIREAKLMNVI